MDKTKNESKWQISSLELYDVVIRYVLIMITRKISTMKYVVTGGAGFIGSHISEYLMQQGHDVVIIDNLYSGNEKNIRTLKNRKKCIFINGTIADGRLLSELFYDVDGVFHNAAVASVPVSLEDPALCNETNITGTLNVLIAARDNAVKRVVFSSSAAVYGNLNTPPQKETMKPAPQSPYAVSKLAGEEYCSVFSSAFNLSTISLRYFNVYGPRQNPLSDYAPVIPRFIEQTLADQAPTIFGDGNQSRDFVYVEDVVQANIRAMESNLQGIFNISGGKYITINELASTISEFAGMGKSPVHSDPRPADVRESFADISKAQNKLHFVPETSIKAGLKKTIRWYKGHKES